jgi:DNA end-binding protein Ku
MPQSVWSGNLRLSLVLVPVKLYTASEVRGVSFRMIHEPSGKPIRYSKGVRAKDGTFTEVDEDEIVKGYEHAKGHYVLLNQSELDDVKLEASHTIDMTVFVDRDAIDSRYFEKPYYLLPDGETAEEGYTVLREALKKTGKVAVGQIIMGGREHIVGILPHEKGLMLSILRYANEVRDAGAFFDTLPSHADAGSVALAKELVESMVGKFEPRKMPDEYAEAVERLVKAKVKGKAPEVAIETSTKEPPKVVNIMSALKQSMQKQGRAKLRDAVARRTGKIAKPKTHAGAKRARPAPRRTAH